MIDLIVPVFRGLEETKRCIESVLCARQSTGFELVVVDDATPEPAIAAYLDDLANRSSITLLRNDRNLGFVGSANRGMSVHPDRDVVLLNSDTEVANDWLDRLHRCAYSQPDIGIVTPFSNNATICSYPFDGWCGGVPGTLGLSALDSLIAACNAGRSVDIPTAVGFCMLIRRACIDRVGLFDEDRFGRGYGEENDFSLRAAIAGWRSVLSADVFVFHSGSVSFGEERAILQERAMKSLLDLHPGYLHRLGDFSARNPLQSLRNSIDLARIAKSEEERRQVKRERTQATRRESAKPTQLHLTHSWDGGTNRWIADFCRRDRQRRNLVLRSVSNRNVAAWRVELLDPSECDVPLMAWNLDRHVRATDICHLEYMALLEEVVDAFDVRAFLVSSLIGHSLDVFDIELPTVVVLHDLYPFCPALFACFDSPCTQCATDTLKSCMRRNPYNAFWHNTSADDWLSLRQAYAQRLILPQVSIAAPTQSAWTRWTTLFPAIAESPCRIIPHGIDLEAGSRVAGASSRSRVSGGKLRLVLPGRLLPHKGLELFARALPNLIAHAEILLLGCGKFGRPFEHIPGVEIVRTYSRQELARHVEAFCPDAALMLSVVPESFSYTLSEMFALGLPVLATELGAFAERIEPGTNGLLFEPNPDALSELVSKLARDPDVLSIMRGNLARATPHYVDDMIRDYHAMLPLIAAKPVAPGHGLVRSPVAARWLVNAARDRQQLASDNQNLRHEVGEQAARISTLDAALSESRSRCSNLERELEYRGAEKAAIFRSRSWRWAAPLRSLSDRLRRLSKLFVDNGAMPVRVADEKLDVVEPVTSVSGVFILEPSRRGNARRSLRESIGVSDASRVVLSLIPIAGAKTSKLITELAGQVLATRNDAAFLFPSLVDAGRIDVEMESALLVATRKLLVLPDGVDIGVAIAGADVLLLDRDTEIQPYLPLIEGGVKLLVLGPDSECERAGMELQGALRYVSIDALERVPEIFFDWFGESIPQRADTDEE